MGIRENLAKNRGVSVGGAMLLLLVTLFVLARQSWPQKKANLSQAYYTDDDGQTWFSDSALQVPPFDHNGHPAVLAEIYTYDDGKKQFCAYMAKYNPSAKRQLESAIADAKSRGQSPGSIALFSDPEFIKNGMMAKLPGDKNHWVAWTDPGIGDVISIHSPDGSAVDQAMVY